MEVEGWGGRKGLQKAAVGHMSHQDHTFPVVNLSSVTSTRALEPRPGCRPAPMADIRGRGRAGGRHLLSVCKDVSHMGAAGQIGKTLSNVTRGFCFQRLCDLEHLSSSLKKKFIFLIKELRPEN